MQQNFLLSTIIAFLFLIVSCSSEKKSPQSTFEFRESAQGVELLDNGIPVFFYQREPKSSTGEFICNNYIHPLYSLNGDTLTEEFPSDHPFHRGIFWAWHQVFVDTLSVGDQWIMEHITQEVDSIAKENNNQATIQLKVKWKSPLFKNGQSFMEEVNSIVVHPKEQGIRKIDCTISLKALVPGVSIGGSDDAKGYGGFCARLKDPEKIIFTSAAGKVTPQELQLNSGKWMDFSAPFNKAGEVSGLAILCHSTTPNYPAPWILRQSGSMQNIVFPGRNRVSVSETEPTILNYRFIIHDGGVENINIDSLQNEYVNGQ